VNLVDIAILVLCLLSAVRGWRLGLFGQVFELGGGFLGLIAGALLAPRVASLFTDEGGLQGALISLAVLLVVLSIGQGLGYIAGHRFGTLAMRARLGGLDSGLGAAFGIALTLVAAWLIASMLVDGPSRPIARTVQQSSVLRRVSGVLPRPPNVFAYLRDYLDTSGFPQVFAGFPRPVGPPVKLPKDDIARRAVAKADQSTVQIVVPACGGTQLGSGWIAATATVVTNAHVVSGGDTVTVRDTTGDHTGEVVLFDPKTDVAVIHVEGTRGPPLRLETGTQTRGAPGATLGYPGGRGTLSAHKAAVQDHYEATGRDIYGRSTVTRQIYELRSPVREGDSGGPFVLPNGRVAGVVFAASTAHGDTGYALTGAEVADEVEQGSGRTSPVGTGRCNN
jgi:S1-C subfamily serine protease